MFKQLRNQLNINQSLVSGHLPKADIKSWSRGGGGGLTYGRFDCSMKLVFDMAHDDHK